MKEKKHSFWLALTIFSLMGQVAWVVENMYFNVFIYKTFSASAADISNMVAASAVTATLTTVFMGALSDKIGKRKLFISLGYILWGISIFSFVFLKEDIISKAFPMAVSAASVGVTLAIILDCVMTFFGSTANDAAFNAWLTDSTNSKNRGAAEGINAMMPLVSVLVVFGGFMFLNLDEPSSWTIIFSIIGGLTLIIGILGIFIIKEPNIKPVETSYIGGIVYGFKPSTIRKNINLYICLLAFIIFNISIQIFMPYLIIYYEVSLGMSDYVLVMAPAIIIASVVTALWGKVYDKKGFSFSGIFALVFLILGYIILYLTKTKLPVFIGSLLMMSGYLSGMAVFGAVIRDNTPEGKSGRLQGVRIFSQVFVPGIVGPFIGKTVLSTAQTIIGNDGTASFVPNENIFLAALIAAVLVLPFFLFLNNKKPRKVFLETDFEKGLDETPFAEYPRPQFKRDSYLCLNGKWNFKIKRKEKEIFSGEILVPFAVESRISGVFKEIEKKDTLIYEKTFKLENMGQKVILNFTASDQYTAVFLNGNKIGENVGGYLPFSFDITKFLIDGENKLTVEVKDPLNKQLPYGKQTEKQGGMWYTKISGIWGTVWLETLPQTHIENIKITPDLKGALIEVFGGEDKKILEIEGETYEFSGDKFRIDIENPILWTPENPHLYEFSISSGEDKIESYFGLRTIEIKGKDILFNGEPYFFNGLLDQGYFSDGIFLPATGEGFKNDILKMKECGFNMLRKHIKLEPELFYYYCDKYGMIVFQDMINSGKYSFLIDTALPTVFLKKGIEHRASKIRKEEFEKTSRGIIENLYNHPSVVYYTIFNEGWGQFDADKYYKEFKKLDSTRVYDSTSGWFEKKLSDVKSEHIYFKPIKLKESEKPLVLSEFGGYSCKIENHCFNLDKTYGYRFFKDREKFENALVELYEKEVIPAIDKGLCATVLTQVSDVEDETNGLLTYDRKVLKVNPERFRELSQKLQEKFKSKKSG